MAGVPPQLIPLGMLAAIALAVVAYLTIPTAQLAALRVELAAIVASALGILLARAKADPKAKPDPVAHKSDIAEAVEAQLRDRVHDLTESAQLRADKIVLAHQVTSLTDQVAAYRAGEHDKNATIRMLQAELSTERAARHRFERERDETRAAAAGRTLSRAADTTEGVAL